jgi:hypothetical protein
MALSASPLSLINTYPMQPYIQLGRHLHEFEKDAGRLQPRHRRAVRRQIRVSAFGVDTKDAYLAHRKNPLLDNPAFTPVPRT